MYFYGILKKMKKIHYCKCFTVCAILIKVNNRMSPIRCRQYNLKILNGAQRKKKVPKGKAFILFVFTSC